jgi:Raf kinase inhibitor-like YbhB/YbcL family protein
MRMRPSEKRHSVYQDLKPLIRLVLMVCGLISLSVPISNAEGKMTFSISSHAFDDGQAIPARYTCQGEDISPDLHWHGVPAKTRSLAMIVDDPDAPDPRAPKTTWVHWVLYNMPPAATGLPEGATTDNLPAGSEEGLNDWKRTGYGGPCPPIGRHRYFFKLYALDTVLEGLRRPTKAQVEEAMQGHVIEKTEFVGTYQKSK